MPRDESQKDEQAKIVDKLLRQLPHANPTLSDVDRRPRGEATRHPSTPQATKVGVPRQPSPPNPLAVWGRAGIGLVLGIGITQWPYHHSCGWPLLGYGAAILLVGVAGVWSALFSWRGHMAVAHVISLMLVAWWGVLTAAVVLPRMGYARETATWFCADETSSAPAAVPTLPPIQAAPAEAVGDSVVSQSLDSTAASGASQRPDTVSR
jgi:hypothetical protein